MPARAATYLDSNAGAPLHPEVIEALLPLLREESSLLPNPSSIHAHGREAKKWLTESREKIAASIGAIRDAHSIVFTSSGSEANQLAIRSVLEPALRAGGQPHWITTAVEHDSVLQMADWLKSQGGNVSYLPVSEQGVPQLEALSSLLTPVTVLVSAVWANNETGVLTPVQDLISRVRAQKPGIAIHVDAAQAWGKVPVQVDTLGADYVTFSGHKIGALAGVGVLWTAKDARVSPLILGKQERERRGGTENLLGVLSMGIAAEARKDPVAWARPVEQQRDWLEQEILRKIPGAIVNGSGAPRVANTLNLNFEGVEEAGLVMALDLAGYSVSSGSACSSGVPEPSHVLMAMGRTRSQAKAAIRISLSGGPGQPGHVEQKSLEGFIEALGTAVARIRGR